MTTGERMKLRRKELGLSADVIASALNVSIASVYRYENGEIEKMPISILKPLAKVLHTNSHYLMGFSDDPSELAEVSSSGLDEYQTRILKFSDQLNGRGKEKLLEYAEDLTQIQKYVSKETTQS